MSIDKERDRAQFDDHHNQLVPDPADAALLSLEQAAAPLLSRNHGASSKSSAHRSKGTMTSKISVRIIIGTGNSQDEVVDSLVGANGTGWGSIEVFHMDEDVGVTDTHANLV